MAGNDHLSAEHGHQQREWAKREPVGRAYFEILPEVLMRVLGLSGYRCRRVVHDPWDSFGRSVIRVYIEGAGLPEHQEGQKVAEVSVQVTQWDVYTAQIKPSTGEG